MYRLEYYDGVNLILCYHYLTLKGFPNYVKVSTTWGSLGIFSMLRPKIVHYGENLKNLF